MKNKTGKAIAVAVREERAAESAPPKEKGVVAMVPEVVVLVVDDMVVELGTEQLMEMALSGSHTRNSLHIQE